MVRQADIDVLVRLLLDTLTQGATLGVRSQLRPQEWMVSIPACAPAISADHPVGSRATRVTVTVQVICRAEMYDQQAARRLAAASFMQETHTALGTPFTPVGQVRTTLVDVRVIDPQRGMLALSLETEGVWVYQWTSKQLEALVRHIAGARKWEALTRLLCKAGVQAASILLSGRERTMLPADPSRITIIVTGEQPG